MEKPKKRIEIKWDKKYKRFVLIDIDGKQIPDQYFCNYFHALDYRKYLELSRGETYFYDMTTAAIEGTKRRWEQIKAARQAESEGDK